VQATLLGATWLHVFLRNRVSPAPPAGAGSPSSPGSPLISAIAACRFDQIHRPRRPRQIAGADHPIRYLPAAATGTQGILAVAFMNLQILNGYERKMHKHKYRSWDASTLLLAITTGFSGLFKHCSSHCFSAPLLLCSSAPLLLCFSA
jgi:hypothetical protein